MESSKNKQAAKNKQKEIKKAAGLRAQGGGLSAQTPYASKKRKHTPDVQSLGKGANSPSIRPDVREVAADAPHHEVRKGLITS